MTLDYKILGQLYYGPEINQEIEIPGTSGYYGSYKYYVDSTKEVYIGSLATGSTDLVYSEDFVNWQRIVLPYTVFNLASYNDERITYGNGVFVMTPYNPYGSSNFFYSDNGLTWTLVEVATGEDMRWSDTQYINNQLVKRHKNDT
jgi:hypothetical protein